MTTVVYLVKNAEVNEELRYSLRSLANLEHDQVVFVGHRPSWVRNVALIPGNRHPTKGANVYTNLRAACVLGEFVVMNDDFYIMEPTVELPSYHRCPLAEHVETAGRGWWRRSLAATAAYLERKGHVDPLSYEVHVPVVMNGELLAAVLDDAAGGVDLPQWRTLYGNVYGVPSERISVDPKLRSERTAFDPAWRFVSTDDAVWPNHPGTAAIRARFPARCRYED